MDTTRGSLLVRIRDNADRTAWTQFDRIYRPMLFKFARARGLDDATSEDIVQHVMMAIQSHIKEFNYDPQNGRFRGWLKTVVNNRIRNLLAKKHEPGIDSRAFDQADSQIEAPDDLFDRMWMKEHLDHALHDLKESVEPLSYAAFEAYVLKEQVAEDVCRQFNLSANQLYSIKFRLTRKLSDLMTGLLGDDSSTDASTSS